jgi:hypothetical protein
VQVVNATRASVCLQHATLQQLVLMSHIPNQGMSECAWLLRLLYATDHPSVDGDVTWDQVKHQLAALLV